MTNKYGRWLDQLLKEINVSSLDKFVKEGEQVILEVESGSVIVFKEKGILAAKDMSAPSYKHVLSSK